MPSDKEYVYEGWFFRFGPPRTYARDQASHELACSRDGVALTGLDRTRRRFPKARRSRNFRWRLIDTKGANGHPLSHSRPSYEKFFSYDRRIRARVPGRFTIGTRTSKYAHMRGSLRTPARVAASRGLAKYYFFTFYGERKFTRLVAPLRRETAEGGDATYKNVAAFWRETARIE